MVPSPKVATYDLQPEMSAPELTDRAVAAIESGRYDLIVLNYANPDMVGHTGNLDAAIRAVEAVDHGLGRIAEAIDHQGGALLVLADHGNCEMMRDPVTGGPPHRAHHQPRAGDAARRPGRHPGRRPPGRHRPNLAGADGPAATARNDRPVAAATGLALPPMSTVGRMGHVHGFMCCPARCSVADSVRSAAEVPIAMS